MATSPLDPLIQQLKQQPATIEFNQVINTITQCFTYKASGFRNGPTVYNAAHSNEGSCKIFAFGKLMGLSKEETLACFGKYYREDVLQHPNGDDHANIRAFIQYGWEGIEFEADALTTRIS